MGHYAHINENNVVDNVIVAQAEFINSGAVGDPSRWIKTSYNTRGGKHYKVDSNEEDDGIPLRKNYAVIGGTYSPELDAFIPMCPGLEYELDLETCDWKLKEKKNV